MKTENLFSAEEKLTINELRAISLLLHSLKRTVMADLLGLAPGTLDQRLNRIFLKLQLPSNVAVALWAVDNGFDRCGNLNGVYLFEGYTNLPWQKKAWNDVMRKLWRINWAVGG